MLQRPEPPLVQASIFPMVAFEPIELASANRLLVKWGHKMGPLRRGNQGAWCHALLHESKPVGIATASYLIGEYVGGCDRTWNRSTVVELSRLAAARPGLCRVVLRLWREFALPDICRAGGFVAAVSYQDSDLHNGNTYRFDGWKKIGTSHSGTDTRSGRPGRNKVVWLWESLLTAPCPNEGCLHGLLYGDAGPVECPECGGEGRIEVDARGFRLEGD